ncbi:MAG: hypothetical protein IJ781_03325, partial [Atopobiaceae bacterium]|nr:hypothetical protein [Atopobiaceae bacterium]
MVALALAAATFLLAGCRSAAPEDSNVTLVTKTAQEATEAEEDPGASQTEEEMFVSGSNHVTTYVPSADEVARINALDWSAASQHMTPDATRAAGTVAHPTGIDPTTSQVFYLWEEDNMPGGDGYGYDDPGFMPAVTTVPVP